MRDHSIYTREERGLEPDIEDVFSEKNEPLLGCGSPIPPGARGSMIAVDLGHYGPNNAPAVIGYPGSTTPDAWHMVDGIWKRCAPDRGIGGTVG